LSAKRRFTGGAHGMTALVESALDVASPELRPNTRALEPKNYTGPAAYGLVASEGIAGRVVRPGDEAP
jgi:hypothetical protein